MNFNYIDVFCGESLLADFIGCGCIIFKISLLSLQFMALGLNAIAQQMLGFYCIGKWFSI